MQFGRLQKEIASLRGRRELLLQSPTSWISDDESALAFHGSIFDPRGEAIKLFVLKHGFPSASPSSPPNLSHSVSLLRHSPLRSEKPSARTEEAPCQSYPTPPISRLPLISSTSSVTTSFSPRHLFSLFPTFSNHEVTTSPPANSIDLRARLSKLNRMLEHKTADTDVLRILIQVTHVIPDYDDFLEKGGWFLRQAGVVAWPPGWSKFSFSTGSYPPPAASLSRNSVGFSQFLINSSYFFDGKKGKLDSELGGHIPKKCVKDQNCADS